MQAGRPSGTPPAQRDRGGQDAVTHDSGIPDPVRQHETSRNDGKSYDSMACKPS